MLPRSNFEYTLLINKLFPKLKTKQLLQQKRLPNTKLIFLSLFIVLAWFIKVIAVVQLVLLWFIVVFSNLAYNYMLFVVGSGPGAIHFVNLCAFASLETCGVALIESLVNRSLLTLLNSKCKLKYVGRSLHNAHNSFYGVLLSLLWFNSFRTVSVWVKNGDALLYNRSWSFNVFFSALQLKYTVIPGVTAALTALSVARVCATSQHASNIVLSLSWCCYNKLKPHTLIIYMTRLNALLNTDSLICNGLVSDKTVMLVFSLSLTSQAIVYSSLVSLPFNLISVGESAPSLLLAGDSVSNYANLNWIKSVDNIFS